MLLAEGLNTFARFSGDVAVRREVDEIAMRIDPADFTLQQRQVLLGFALRASDGQTLDPGLIKVTQPSGSGAGVEIVLQKLDTAGEQTSLTLAQLRRGDFAVRVRGELGTTGSYELDVFLAGDANADFRVDQQDINRIRRLRGVRRADPGYLIDADGDRNGTINRLDVRLAQQNLGVSTGVRPLVLTLGLDPASDPDGNGQVNQANVGLQGQSLPGVSVLLDQGSDGSFEQQTLTDGGGQFHFDVHVSIGDTPFSAVARDRFGQERAADLVVDRGSNTTVTTDAGVQQMPSVAVDPLDPNHVVIAFMDRSLVTTGYAGIGVAVSHDGGDTWQRTAIPLPDGFDEGAANPIARFDDQGDAFISFMAATFLGSKPPLTNPNFVNPETGASDRALGFQANNGVFVARSDDGGMNWNQPVAVAAHLFEGQEVFFEVIPDLAIDTFRQLPNGQPNPNYERMYLAWTRLYPVGQFPGHPEITGGSDIMIAVSQDGGQHWETQFQDVGGVLATVIQDSDNTFGFPGLGIADQARLAIGPEGDIYLSNFGAGDFTVHHSADGGASFAAPNHTTGERIAFGTGFTTFPNADGLPHNRFRTHSVRAIAADPTRPGEVYAAEPVLITDRLGNQLDGADVFFARSTDYGVTWERSFQVGPNSATVLNDDNDGQKATGLSNDVISGQALARLAIDSQGNVGSIWYDTRRDPADHLLDVFSAVSSDGGRNFSPNFRVTDFSFDADAGRFTDAAGRDNFYLGDFIGLALAGNQGYAAWTDTRNGNQDIIFRRFPLNPLPIPLNDRLEPNETPTSATMLGRVVQRLLPKLAVTSGDQDWFELESAATGTVIASVRFDDPSSVPTGALGVELWDETGSLRLAIGNDLLDEAGNVIGQEVRFPGSAGQKFLVHVLGSSARGNDRVRYSLNLQSLTADLGTRALAHVTGQLAPGGGALYVVRAASAGSVEVRLTGGADVQGDLNLQILDAETFDLLATGQSGPASTAESAEPNDSIGQANPTGLVGPGSVTIDSQIGDGSFGTTSGDYDFFSFHADANERVTVDLDPKTLGSQLDGGILLYDSVGNLLGAQDCCGPGTPEQLSLLTPSTDTFFVAVFGFGSNLPSDPFTPGTGSGVGSTGGFRLTITTESLGPGAAEQATLAIQKDQRVFLLVTGEDAASRGSFTFDFINLDQFTTPDNDTLLFSAGAGPSQAALGDLNHDGNLDLVVANALSDTISVLLGNGDGSFQSPRQFSLGAYVRAKTDNSDRFPTFGREVEIADFNLDGNPDVVATNFASSDVSVLLGRGDGTFESQRRFGATFGPFDLDVGDLNGDGVPDLAAISPSATSQFTVAALLGRGDGTFQPQNTTQVAAGGSNDGGAVHVADFNQDGNGDLLVSGHNSLRVSVLLGNGDGTFQQQQDLDGPDLGLASAIADIDGDGKLDIIVVGLVSAKASLLLGNGDGTFQPQQQFFVGQSPVGVALGDLASEVQLPDGSTALGPPDGHLDLIVANSGIPAVTQIVGPPQVVILPALVDGFGKVVGFGLPKQLAGGQAPQDVDVGDVNGDGAPDVAVVDRDAVFIIFGKRPVITPGDTLQTARNLGTVVHVVQPTLTIVPGHEDAFFNLTVPTEAARGSGDEVLDFSGFFQHQEGAGLSMEVLDAGGNIIASGERFRVRAAQGQVLTLHVYGVAAVDGTRGAGAYTLDINVLPQVVSVEAQPLLPGAGANPGGPTSNLVVTLQGDRLDPATAEDPTNYRVTWLGSDGAAGTPDDQLIPITCGTAASQCVVYDPSANVDVASGKTFPTAVRQTVTLTFGQPLPTGSYDIELLPGIQTAPFSEDEAGLLAGNAGFMGHPVVSVVRGTVVEGSRQTAVDLVLAAGGLGDFSVFKTGTPFLTQLHGDLAALLDSKLTELGDDPSVTPAIMDLILERFNPSLGPPGTRPTPAVVIWIDPGGVDVEDPNGDDVIYDPDDDEIVNENDCAFIDVTGNIIVIVFVDCGGGGGTPGGFGTFSLELSNLGPTARGGVVSLGQTENEAIELTDDLRAGITSFTLEF